VGLAGALFDVSMTIRSSPWPIVARLCTPETPAFTPGENFFGGGTGATEDLVGSCDPLLPGGDI